MELQPTQDIDDLLPCGLTGGGVRVAGEGRLGAAVTQRRRPADIHQAPALATRVPPRKRFLADKSPEVIVKIREALQEVEYPKEDKMGSEPSSAPNSPHKFDKGLNAKRKGPTKRFGGPKTPPTLKPGTETSAPPAGTTRLAQATVETSSTEEIITAATGTSSRVETVREPT
ncbi:hypothetical protein AAG570_009674 [Ranatra chinensis]|uniref:Uncharacterized protein n=1 Tax=Ranatra chinensis TaxID=642074 RepID=A0ABD0YPR3_9HEMI